MRLPRSGIYALRAAMEMALADGESVTAAEVARRHGIPPSVLAKVFQRLVRAGIAEGHRGVGGGYRLARDPSSVTILQVLDPFEPPAVREVPESVEARFPGTRLRALLQEVDGTMRCTFASVTLATLVREPEVSGA